MIDEEYGVFVSPDGDDDSGDGSRANPYATIAKGIEEAAASEKRVYACADGGVYDESVTIDDAASGLEMFGGFSCDDWSYSETAKSRVASPTALALHVDGVTGVRIEDFAFEAADATMPGESSIGAFVANATNIVFRRLTIEAGLGFNGANGTRQDFAFPTRSSLDGNNANGGTGAMAKTCECPGGAQTIGGVGGTVPNQAGGAGAPDHAGPGGEGGTPGLTCIEGVGRNGAPAPASTSASGASTRGALNSNGWTPIAGTDGVDGAPGQGGGGGASALLTTGGGGGGGGCGSCGGAGGPGGKGGGASIALAISRERSKAGSVRPPRKRRRRRRQRNCGAAWANGVRFRRDAGRGRVPGRCRRSRRSRCGWRWRRWRNHRGCTLGRRRGAHDR